MHLFRKFVHMQGKGNATHVYEEEKLLPYLRHVENKF